MLISSRLSWLLGTSVGGEWGVIANGYGSVCVCSVEQSCLTLCDPMYCSLLGSSLHGISQARILKQVAISYSRGSSQPGDWTCVSCGGRWILYHCTSWEAPSMGLRYEISFYCAESVLELDSDGKSWYTKNSELYTLWGWFYSRWIMSQFFLSYWWIFKNKCTYRNTPSAKVIIFLWVKNKNFHPKDRKGLGYFSDPRYLTLCWNF